MKFIIILALVAMAIYYLYSAYQIIRDFIEKKRAKNAASKINDTTNNIDEQTNGE